MPSQSDIKKVIDLFKQQKPNVPLEAFTSPYDVLISTVMSARTNDDTTLPAAKRLLTKAPNPYKLFELSEEKVASLIYPVGFYKTKAKNLKKLAEQLITDFNGNVPNKKEELVALAGVGTKTANLVLNRAFGKPAISVDTHVHHISNLLGWVNTKKPEDTEKELVKIIPTRYWKDVNSLFVSLGRNMKTRKRLEQFLAENGLIKKL